MSDASSINGVRDRRWLNTNFAAAWVVGAATIMAHGCTGVRLPSVWRTQSQALPGCASAASMVDE